jgi:hypothetical protein
MNILLVYVSRGYWGNNFGMFIPKPPIKTNGTTKSKQPKIELRINTDT